MRSKVVPALNVRVVSYNVLSSSLASPGYFTSCDPENLRARARLEVGAVHIDARACG